MRAKKRIVFVLAGLMAVQSQGLSQFKLQSGTDYSDGIQAWPNFTKVFKNPVVGEPNMANSPRLDQLIAGGRLYLSLNDALALAIENNLDIASARYGPKLADTDILRAKSGAQLRGVQTQITNLSTATSVAGGGGGGRGGDATGITGRAGGAGGGVAAVGDASSFFGTNVPNLDPTLTGGIDWGHFSNPQTSNFVTGTNTFINETSNSSLAFRKNFLTGSSLSLTWANRLSETNSQRANFNPSLRSNLTFGFRQRLLQGFGLAVNSRNITVSKNNREVSDLAFEQQVVETTTRVENLYWDLVSFRADVEGREEDLRLSKRLYQDNKRRVEIGTLAPIEIVRAEAEVASREQDLALAVTRVQLQETLLKNAISTNGLASPSLLLVEIVPTDTIQVPEKEQIQPIQDLMTLALRSRPEMTQSRIQMHNRDISLKGIRNAMLPQVDLVADVTNNGLAGQINNDFNGLPGQNNAVSGFFLGGLGTSVTQLFRRNFPDYSIGIQMTIPLKNRRAQADMTATLLERRQAQIRLRQQENAIRAEVNNAVIGVQQTRAIYRAARQTRILQEKTLHAEQRKFDLGVSTIFLVVQAQRDLALARSGEITSQNNYVKSRVELARVTGQALTANNISVNEAYQGTVSKPADPLPPNAGLEDLEDDTEATDLVAGPDQAALNTDVGQPGPALDQPSAGGDTLTQEDYLAAELLFARAAALDLGVTREIEPEVTLADNSSDSALEPVQDTSGESSESGAAQSEQAKPASADAAEASTAPEPEVPAGAASVSGFPQPPAASSEAQPARESADFMTAEAGAASNSPEPVETLTALQVSDDGTSLRILFPSLHPKRYKTFHIENPARIVLDISNAIVAVPKDQRTLSVSHPEVNRIRIEQSQSHPPVARLVLEVSSIPDVEISMGAEGLELLIPGSKQSASGLAAGIPESGQEGAEASPAKTAARAGSD